MRECESALECLNSVISAYPFATLEISEDSQNEWSSSTYISFKVGLIAPKSGAFEATGHQHTPFQVDLDKTIT